MNLLRLTPFEFQCRDGSSGGTSDIQEELGYLASRKELGDRFLPNRKVGSATEPADEWHV